MRLSDSFVPRFALSFGESVVATLSSGPSDRRGFVIFCVTCVCPSVRVRCPNCLLLSPFVSGWHEIVRIHFEFVGTGGGSEIRKVLIVSYVVCDEPFVIRVDGGFARVRWLLSSLV